MCSFSLTSRMEVTKAFSDHTRHFQDFSTCLCGCRHVGSCTIHCIWLYTVCWVALTNIKSTYACAQVTTLRALCLVAAGHVSFSEKHVDIFHTLIKWRRRRKKRNDPQWAQQKCCAFTQKSLTWAKHDSDKLNQQHRVSESSVDARLCHGWIWRCDKTTLTLKRWVGIKKKEWNDETSKAALQGKKILSILGLSIQKEVLLSWLKQINLLLIKPQRLLLHSTPTPLCFLHLYLHDLPHLWASLSLNCRAQTTERVF